MHYSKQAISVEAQVAHLIARGMRVADPAQAAQHLRYVGYFRLRGYFSSLVVDPLDWSLGFRPGTDFELLLALYNMDRDLRLLFMHLLERFEVAVRTLLVQHFCPELGAAWYEEEANFKLRH